MKAKPTEVPDLPALDETDEDPDALAGDIVAAEHDLDVDSFDVDEQSDSGILIEGDR